MMAIRYYVGDNHFFLPPDSTLLVIASKFFGNAILFLALMLIFILLLQQLIASATHLVAKTVTNDVDPRMVVLIRVLFTMLAYTPVLLVRRRHLPVIEKEDYAGLMLLGLLNLPINQLLFLSGMEFTTAPNASLLYALSPVFVLVVGRLIYNERLSLKKSIGVALALTGTTVVLLEKGIDFSSSFFWGNFMVLWASISWAFYTLLGKKYAAKYGALYTTALSMYTGFVLYLPVYAVFPVSTTFAELTVAHWGQLFFLGVITSGVGYALWNYALSLAEASKVSVFNNLQPILTTILAFLFLGTEPGLLFIIGGVVAIIGVVITQKG